MRTLNETQMQVLEAAAKAGGASPERVHNRTVASLVKQELISKKRSRGDKHSLVATPAGVARLRERASMADTSETTPPSPARVAQAPEPKSLRVAKPKQARPSEPMSRAAMPKSRKVEAASPQPAAREAQGKLGLLIGLLRQPEGATLAAMVTATGWQAHSVRGAMAGAIKKKLDLPVVSKKLAQSAPGGSSRPARDRGHGTGARRPGFAGAR